MKKNSKFCPLTRNSCDLGKCAFGGNDDCRLIINIEAIASIAGDRLRSEKEKFEYEKEKDKDKNKEK